MKIEVTRILPNPHRDLKANPIRFEQVDNILESVKRNGFWDNLVVRKSPTRPDHFELAYGHHRMAAVVAAGITEVDMRVRNLDEWAMFNAMVDENVTQATITTDVVYENVGVGARLLEQYLRECETAEAFQKKLARPAPDGLIPPNSYAEIRNTALAGEGVGKDLVLKYVPAASKSNSVVAAVLESIYGEARKRAADKRAAEAAEASRKADAVRKVRQAETDAAQAAQRKAEQAEREAAEALRKANADTKAKAKAADTKAKADAAEARRKTLDAERVQKAIDKEAKELADKHAERVAQAAKLALTEGVDEKLLRTFESPTTMAEFANTVKRLNIPASKHAAAAKAVQDGEWSQKVMRERLPAWWDIESGAYKAREDALRLTAAREALDRRMQGGDLNAFLVTVNQKMADVKRELVMVRDAVQHASPTMKAHILREWPQYSELIDDIVTRAGTGSTERNITPATKMISHRNS